MHPFCCTCVCFGLHFCQCRPVLLGQHINYNQAGKHDAHAFASLRLQLVYCLEALSAAAVACSKCVQQSSCLEENAGFGNKIDKVACFVAVGG